MHCLPSKAFVAISEYFYISHRICCILAFCKVYICSTRAFLDLTGLQSGASEFKGWQMVSTWQPAWDNLGKGEGKIKAAKSIFKNLTVKRDTDLDFTFQWLVSTKIMKNGYSCSQNLIFDRLCNITKSANFCPSKVTNQLYSRFFGTYLPSLDFLTPQGKKVNQGEAPRGGASASGKTLVNHCNSFLGNAHFNWVFHNTYKLATAIVYPKYQPPCCSGKSWMTT